MIKSSILRSNLQHSFKDKQKDFAYKISVKIVWHTSQFWYNTIWNYVALCSNDHKPKTKVCSHRNAIDTVLVCMYTSLHGSLHTTNGQLRPCSRITWLLRFSDNFHLPKDIILIIIWILWVLSVRITFKHNYANLNIMRFTHEKFIQIGILKNI